MLVFLGMVQELCAPHWGQGEDGEGWEQAPQSHNNEAPTVGPPFPAPSLVSFISMGSSTGQTQTLPALPRQQGHSNRCFRPLC